MRMANHYENDRNSSSNFTFIGNALFEQLSTVVQSYFIILKINSKKLTIKKHLQHKRIVEAIHNKDITTAKELMTKHLS